MQFYTTWREHAERISSEKTHRKVLVITQRKRIFGNTSRYIEKFSQPGCIPGRKRVTIDKDVICTKKLRRAFGMQYRELRVKYLVWDGQPVGNYLDFGGKRIIGHNIPYALKFNLQPTLMCTQFYCHFLNRKS